jgi:hypothetical protein
MCFSPENSPALQRWESGWENQPSPVRDGRTFLSSLTGLVPEKRDYPALKHWAIITEHNIRWRRIFVFPCATVLAMLATS